MNITLSLDDQLVRKVRRIVVENHTTLAGLIRAYLEQFAQEHKPSGRRRREREVLEDSFSRFQFKVGKRTSRREDLYARP